MAAIRKELLAESSPFIARILPLSNSYGFSPNLTILFFKKYNYVIFSKC